MATIFYLAFVYFNPVPFNWWWLIISILFSCVEVGGRKVFRYTTDKTLQGKEVKEE